MADETKVEGGQQGGQVDLTALQTMMNQTMQEGFKQIPQQVRDSLKEIVTEEQQNQQQRQTSQQQAADPMLQVVGPYVAPAILEARNAVDAATFYPTTAEAVGYKDEIERVAQAWQAQGRLVPRSDIWLYLQGVHRKELTEAEIGNREQAAERARLASTVGIGSPDRQLGGTRDPYSMSVDELEKALDGVVF